MLCVRDGDIGMLGTLFERHHKILFNFFLRLTGNRAASEDLVQEVFLRMLKYRTSYQGKSHFTLWMYQIARNARIDYLNKQKRGARENENQHEVASDDPSAIEKMESEQSHALVHRALAELPLEDREVLLLSRFQDLKYKEIAEILGCAEGTVKARAYALNGEVNVRFTKNPAAECYFGSLNGDVTVEFLPNLSADLRLKTFNGSIFTDFPMISLPQREATAKRKDGKFVYQADKSFGARIGNGGPEIEFDGFNGNIYIKEQIVRSER